MTALARVLDELLAATRASRVTLRRDLPGTTPSPSSRRRWLRVWARSARKRTVDLRRQPVVRELAHGRQVVQDDCRAAYDDPAFQAMLDAFGGLGAQIVTPVVRGEKIVAIVSVHQLALPARGRDDEIVAAAAAADRVGALL